MADELVKQASLVAPRGAGRVPGDALAARLALLRRRQAESLGYLVIRAGQLWNERGVARVNAQAAAARLREAHTRLLPHLQAPEGIRLTELARRLAVTKQAVQPLVADLVAAGVVRVEPDPADARARRLRLTPAGVEAMLHGTAVLRALEAELSPAMGAREAAQLKRLLARLLAILEAQPAAPGDPGVGPARKRRPGRPAGA